MYSPTGMGRSKFETNPRYAVNFSELTITIVDQLHLHKTTMELMYNDSCIFHQTLPHRNIAHERTNTTDFQMQQMRWNSIVSEHRKVFGSGIILFLDNTVAFFNEVGTNRNLWKVIKRSFE